MNLAVGFFDGVHLGHRRILARADAALTFQNHPATIFASERAPALLMTSVTRLRRVAEALRPPTGSCTLGSCGLGRCGLGSCGLPEAASPIDQPVRALSFTPELAAQSPEDFADWLRATYPDLETVFCGANWTFGAGGRGTPDFLRARGFQVEVVPYVELDGQPLSSTRVRTAIAAGDLTAAAEMLGRPWALEGTLVAGKGLGRELGYPTLNVRPAANLVRPPCGVYAVETPYGRGIANYGHAPTMGDQAWSTPILEVHVFTQNLDASIGSAMTVEMLRFIRPERRFNSLDELKVQIARDIAQC